jgi:hypothetical protein
MNRIPGTRRLRHGLPGSALVGPDQFRDREDLALQRPLQVPHTSAMGKPEVLGHRVEPEPVAVTPVPAGRAGSAVADRAEVVAALQRRCLSLGKPACVWGDAPGQPVGEPPPWRVGIVQDERE